MFVHSSCGGALWIKNGGSMHFVVCRLNGVTSVQSFSFCFVVRVSSIVGTVFLVVSPNTVSEFGRFSGLAFDCLKTEHFDRWRFVFPEELSDGLENV